MGGLGSGRHSGFPTTLDDYHKFDLAYLRRHDLLTPGYNGQLRWLRGGREIGAIRYYVDIDTITLLYNVRNRGTGFWEEITELVALLRTRQPLGGERLWFACPRCGRRCSALYGGRRFLCRHCVDVPYASQNEGPHDRQLKRAQDIRIRLGGSGSLGEWFPPKPKGMHWKTYNRLRTISERYANASMVAAAKRFRLLGNEITGFLE